MLKQRVLVVIVLLPIGLAAISFGGIYFFLLVALILGLASWEYGGLFQAGGYSPARLITTTSVLALAAGRHWLAADEAAFPGDSFVMALTVILAMTWHLAAYERGRDQAGTDFAITLGGVMYVGLLGAYLINLRALPDGVWWTLTVLPAIWLADSGAYFVGRSFGKSKFSPRLSPKKTWEGYLGGVVVGTLGTALLALLWQSMAGEPIAVTPKLAAILGLILSVVAPFGDLGKSMIKRQVGVKDSSNMLPGHGGALDRIDTWLWAAALGYYLILWWT